LEKQREIQGTIAAQVARLLEQARVDTENKVKMELKTIRDHMVMMDTRLDQMLAVLDGVEVPAELPLDADQVGALLSKIEQQWGQEIRTLKEELHQTILAHNHNADLIKHHKDTIDELRSRCTRMQTGSSTRSAAEIQVQLARLDALPKQQQTQRKLEPLFERLALLERKVATAAAARRAPWQYPGMPPMPPMGMGMRPPMGMGMSQAAMMSHLGAAGLLGGKGGQRPGKGGPNVQAMAAAAAAAAAATAGLHGLGLHGDAGFTATHFGTAPGLGLHGEDAED